MTLFIPTIPWDSSLRAGEAAGIIYKNNTKKNEQETINETKTRTAK